jgi:hypothetical protein
MMLSKAPDAANCCGAQSRLWTLNGLEKQTVVHHRRRFKHAGFWPDPVRTEVRSRRDSNPCLSLERPRYAAIRLYKLSRFPHTRGRRMTSSPSAIWPLSMIEGCCVTAQKLKGELQCMGPKELLSALIPPLRRFAANARRGWSTRVSFPVWASSGTVFLSAAGVATFRWRQSKTASAGIRNLAVAGLAFSGIDFVARLHLLHRNRKIRSIAFRAGLLFGLRSFMLSPFRPPQLAASFIIGPTTLRSPPTFLDNTDGLREFLFIGAERKGRRIARPALGTQGGPFA